MAELLAAVEATLGGAPGAERLRLRVSDDLAALATASSDAQRQGVLNNFKGVAAELAVWRWAPEPVAVQRSVQNQDGRIRATVDVVAASGTWWLEVKATAPFGTSSNAWSALLDQVVRLRACAACHFVGHRRPAVLVVFTLGCSTEVAHALLALGVIAIQPEVAGHPLPPAVVIAAQHRLPLPPPPSSRPAHLDLGTLLALVSSSTHLSPADLRLCQWANANEHWWRSLAEETEAPLLPRLRAALHRHPVWQANDADLVRFEVLLAQAGGDAERSRWRQLKPHIRVVFPPRLLRIELPLPTSSDHCVQVRLEASASHIDDLRRALLRLPPQHAHAIATAAAFEAVLFTSNARLLRRLAPRIHVDHVLHEPRWLCGFEGDEGMSPPPMPPSTLQQRSNSPLPPFIPLPPSFPLDVDILSLILTFLGLLSLEDACRSAAVCRAWREASELLPTLRVRLSHARSPSHLRYWAPPRSREARATARAWTQRLMHLVDRQRALRSLALSGPLEEGLVCKLASHHLRRWPIQSLTLHCHGGFLGPEAVEPLAGWLHTSDRIRNLALANMRVGVHGAAQLALALSTNQSLENLRLVGCGLFREDVHRLVMGLRQHQGALHTVSFAHNRIGEEGCISIAGWLAEGSGCSTLDLHHCHISSTGAVAIAIAIAHDRRRLRAALLQSFLSPQSASLAASFMAGNGPRGSKLQCGPAKRSLRPLHALVLSENAIGPSGTLALALLLISGSSLRRLDLRRNPLGAQGLHGLARALASSCKLPGSEGGWDGEEGNGQLRDLAIWPLRDARLCPEYKDIAEEAGEDVRSAIQDVMSEQLRHWQQWQSVKQPISR